MQTLRKIALTGGAALVLAATAITAWQAQDGPDAPPALAQRASAVQQLVYARPFRLQAPYTHAYRLERPTVEAGYVLVLEIDPELARPRQLAEPVLYVGSQTAERINHGHPSGRAVVLVPAALGPDGLPALDLAAAPMWLGTPELPERVDAASLAAERAKAEREGVRPLGAARAAAALAAGGGLLALPDKTALERFAAELVLRYAPGEEEAARSLLVPLAR